MRRPVCPTCGHKPKDPAVQVVSLLLTVFLTLIPMVLAAFAGFPMWIMWPGMFVMAAGLLITAAQGITRKDTT